MAMCGDCFSSVTISLKKSKTHAPLESVLIERWRQVSVFDKLFNPIGAFYFPQRLANLAYTDWNGSVTFNVVGAHDQYTVVPNDSQTILVNILGSEAVLAPKEAKAEYAYTLYFERGQLKCAAVLVDKNEKYWMNLNIERWRLEHPGRGLKR